MIYKHKYDPEVVSATAAEEIFCYEPSAISGAHRVITQPVQLGETEIPAVESLLAVILAAHVDPSVVPNPLAYDFRRTPKRQMA